MRPLADRDLYRFDRDLMRRRGVALGKEFRGKGVHVALGPMM
jgi:beta-glucosidase-like glycosyl hydrolase